jgi:hypothetical protein
MDTTIGADMRKALALLVVLGLMAAACGTEDDAAGPTTKAAPTGDLTKADGSLVEAFELAEGGADADDIATEVPELQVVDGLILVEVTLTEFSDDAVAALQAAGLTDVRAFPEFSSVTGAVAPANIDDLAAVDGIDIMRAQTGATTNQTP